MFSWYNHGFGETKVTKERFYAAKKSVKIWDVNGDTIVISKLIETKTNVKYFDWIFRWNYKTISSDNG